MTNVTHTFTYEHKGVRHCNLWISTDNYFADRSLKWKLFCGRS